MNKQNPQKQPKQKHKLSHAAGVLCSSGVTYLAVFPQLVALHAVAVVQGDGTGVRDGVKAELLGVLRVSGPDVLPPGEGEHLCARGQQRSSGKVLFLLSCILRLWLGLHLLCSSASSRPALLQLHPPPPPRSWGSQSQAARHGSPEHPSKHPGGKAITRASWHPAASTEASWTALPIPSHVLISSGSRLGPYIVFGCSAFLIFLPGSFVEEYPA